MKPINKKERDIAYRHYLKFEKWIGDKPSFFQKMIADEMQKRLKIIRMMKSISEDRIKLKNKN